MQSITINHIDIIHIGIQLNILTPQAIVKIIVIKEQKHITVIIINVHIHAVIQNKIQAYQIKQIITNGTMQQIDTEVNIHNTTQRSIFSINNIECIINESTVIIVKTNNNIKYSTTQSKQHIIIIIVHSPHITIQINNGGQIILIKSINGTDDIYKQEIIILHEIQQIIIVVKIKQIKIKNEGQQIYVIEVGHNNSEIIQHIIELRHSEKIIIITGQLTIIIDIQLHILNIVKINIMNIVGINT